MLKIRSIHPDVLVKRCNAALVHHAHVWLKGRPSIAEQGCGCDDPMLRAVELGHVRVMPATFEDGELFVCCDGLDDFTDESAVNFVACVSCNAVFKSLDAGRITYY